MERPTLRQLEILAEVARAGTFRGAARHLGLSQVAVSDHIRQLESRLGCALFVRNVGGKPTLSPSGKIVLDHGRNVLFACDALILAAQGAADGVVPETITATIQQPAVEQLTPVVMLDYAMDLDPEELSPEHGEAPPRRETVGEDRHTPEGALVATAHPEQVVPKVEIFEKPDPVTPDAVTDMTATVDAVPTADTIPVEQEAAESGVDAQPVAVSLLSALRDVSPTEEPEPEPEPSAPEEAVGEPAAVREKPITVASHPAILSRFQDKLAAAQEAFPDRPIAVDFARFTPDEVKAPLVSGRIDIALFYALGEVPGLSSDYLWSESWSLFARADHPLAQADVLSLADCVDMPVILFEEANPLRALCEACLVKAGLWPAPTVLETDDFAAIATELLEYGEAVFPAFGVTAAQFGARQGLKRLALAEPLPGVQVRRAVAPAAQDDPTISALAGLLG